MCRVLVTNTKVTVTFITIETAIYNYFTFFTFFMKSSSITTTDTTKVTKVTNEVIRYCSIPNGPYLFITKTLSDQSDKILVVGSLNRFRLSVMHAIHTAFAVKLAIF